MRSTPLQGIENEHKLDSLRSNLSDWKNDLQKMKKEVTSTYVKDQCSVMLYEINKQLERI